MLSYITSKVVAVYTDLQVSSEVSNTTNLLINKAIFVPEYETYLGSYVSQYY